METKKGKFVEYLGLDKKTFKVRSHRFGGISPALRSKYTPRDLEWQARFEDLYVSGRQYIKRPLKDVLKSFGYKRLKDVPDSDLEKIWHAHLDLSERPDMPQYTHDFIRELWREQQHYEDALDSHNRTYPHKDNSTEAENSFDLLNIPEEDFDQEESLVRDIDMRNSLLRGDK